MGFPSDPSNPNLHETAGPFWMTPDERKFYRTTFEGVVKMADMKVPELKAALQGKDLDTSGLKKALQDRCLANGIATKKRTVVQKQVKRKLLKSELTSLLEAKNLNPAGNIDELQTRCNANDIGIEVEEPAKTEGWEGAPKGMRQILWERGFLDPNKIDSYSEKGEKDDFGNVDKSTSLAHLLSACTDFIEERTLLQHVAHELGAEVDRTPKCHPELAGEGIEYSWGKAKQYYRGCPFAQ